MPIYLSGAAAVRGSILRISFEVEGKEVTYKRDPWSGRATLTIGDEVRMVDKVLDPATQIDFATTRARSVELGGHTVVITTVRPRLLGGFRRQTCTISMDGTEVVRRFGY